MGTRHLVAVVQDGKVKVAQYGQFDGYIASAGSDVIDFINNKLSNVIISKKFRDNVRSSFFADDEYIRKSKTECGFDPDQEYVSFGDLNWQKYIETYPQFSRETSTDVLNMLCESPLALHDSFSFGKDSLFCEYAYLIDLDKDQLQIYTGFNKSPLSSEDPALWGNEPNNGGYYPVSLLKVLSFEYIMTYEGDLIEKLEFDAHDPYSKSEKILESVTETILGYVHSDAIEDYLGNELEELRTKIEQFFMESK